MTKPSKHFYADAALQGAVIRMQRALKTLRDEGSIGEAWVAGERQRLVGKPAIDALEEKCAA